MNKFNQLLAAAKNLVKCVGLKTPVVIQPPTEYQQHVAGKAEALLQMLQQSDLRDRFAEMQDFLKQVQHCGVALPNKDLIGWTWYFVYENPERLDLKYPEICMATVGLSCAMDFDSFENYMHGRVRTRP